MNEYQQKNLKNFLTVEPEQLVGLCVAKLPTRCPRPDAGGRSLPGTGLLADVVERSCAMVMNTTLRYTWCCVVWRVLCSVALMYAGVVQSCTGLCSVVWCCCVWCSSVLMYAVVQSCIGLCSVVWCCNILFWSFRVENRCHTWTVQHFINCDIDGTVTSCFGCRVVLGPVSAGRLFRSD